MAYTSKVDIEKYRRCFPERIRELTKERGHTQAEIAAAISTSSQAVGAYLRGETMPKLEYAQALADFFNVSLDYLTGRSDVKTRNTTIRGIHENTGLTEAAIQLLCLYEDGSIAQFLSELILDSTECGINTLSEISAAFYAIKKLSKDKEFCSTLQGEIEVNGLFWKCQDNLTSFIKREVNREG